MEAKRKQKTGEREGKKYHTNFHGNPVSLSCRYCPRDNCQDASGLKWHSEERQMPQLWELQESRDLWVDSHLFFSSLTVTNSKKHQSDLGFSISKVSLQVGHTDAKDKIKAICHRAEQILNVYTANHRKPASHNAWTETNRRGPSRPPESIYFQ